MNIEPDRERVKKIRKEYESKLLDISGVQGMGEGVIEDKMGKFRPCIRIYVIKRDAETLESIPEEIEGIPIEVIEIGKPRLKKRL